MVFGAPPTLITTTGKGRIFGVQKRPSSSAFLIQTLSRYFPFPSSFPPLCYMSILFLEFSSCNFQLSLSNSPFPTIHFQLSISNYPFPTIHFQLSLSNYPFPTIHFQLSISNYPFPTILFQLSISSFLPLSLNLHNFLNLSDFQVPYSFSNFQFSFLNFPISFLLIFPLLF